METVENVNEFFEEKFEGHDDIEINFQDVIIFVVDKYIRYYYSLSTDENLIEFISEETYQELLEEGFCEQDIETMDIIENSMFVISNKNLFISAFDKQEKFEIVHPKDSKTFYITIERINNMMEVVKKENKSTIKLKDL